MKYMKLVGLRPLQRARRLLLLVLGLIANLSATAGTLQVMVSDAAGRPISDTLVYLTHMDGSGLTNGEDPVTQEMDQIDKQFVPLVIAVQRNGMVRFPNSDGTRHHIYSFSPAKTFESRLYGSDNPPEIRFENTGHVILGCNIHDWMIGHIYVLDTAVFGVTRQDGRTSLSAAGRYLLHAVRPETNPPEEIVSIVEIPGEGDVASRVEFEAARPIARERKPSPLQQRFQKKK